MQVDPIGEKKMKRAGSRSKAASTGGMFVMGLALALASACGDAGSVVTEGDWAVITGNVMGQRYAALEQINAENFQNLAVAWEWDAGDEMGTVLARPTPIYVDGMLITVAGERRNVVALDAGTGEQIWSWVEPDTYRWEYSMRKNHGKGVSYAKVDGRDIIYVVTPAFFLHALDAHTGDPIEGFGGAIPIEGFPAAGSVDLLADLGHEYDVSDGIPLETGYITSSSPALVVNGTIVVGNSAEQGYNQSRIENVPGDILGYDARTGAFKWKFNVLPKEGEYGNNEELDTWENDAAEWTGDISSWAPLSADPELGLVYIPTNGATQDFYGGFRPGDNLFSTSIIALDVETGERRWHFQLVHHDIWNYDTSQVPVLGDVTVDGQEIPALMQVGKQAFVYAFNRETGEPIWPIVETPVPAALIPGEQLSPTQPFPTRPAPYDMQGFPMDQVIDFTPEMRAQALENLSDFAWGPFFQAPLHRDNDLGLRSAYWCPGDVGGTNIDGVPAFDPESGILYVTSQKGCTGEVMVPGIERDAREPAPTGTTISNYAVGSAARPANVQGLPLYKPPYSKVTAIDMNTGEHLWWIPVGDTPQRYLNVAEAEGFDIGNTGTGAQASQFVTPTLLFSTGRASDNTPMLYAIDKRTGERLGAVEMPGNVRYGMMTYMHNGEQYVLLQLTGGVTTMKLSGMN